MLVNGNILYVAWLHFVTIIKQSALDYAVGLQFIAFGSYGWGGQSISQIQKELLDMKFVEMLPPIKQLYTPKEELKEIEQKIIDAFKH